ncbi:MAG TPA: DUF4838 domain-containing protein [Candidatus Avimonas sp.]|nr:DUF4838 domain-containing protein [Candidatus Avimonas sp.]HQD38310.1 DUF4838 domain-containing protein [Candidatus Avimonas sp.]
MKALRKTLLVVFAAAVLLLSMVACGKKQENGSDASSSSSAETGETSDTSSAEGTETQKSPQDTENGGGKRTDKPKDGTTTTKKGTGSVSEQKEFVIAENGVAKATIIIPKSPSELVRAAAEDLLVHLRKITKASIMIGYDDMDLSNGNYILVGPTAQTKKLGINQPKGYPGVEQVIVKRIKNYIVLIGNDDGEYRGTEFAVNMFLEKLGCGWFGPNELWQVIPEIKNLSIDKLDINHKPQFSARISNVWYNYKKFSYRWYMGGDKKHVGHGIPNLISREEFAKTKPEWFALVNGRRDPYTTTDTYWQYCYTNHELAHEVAKKIIGIFDKDPRLTNYSIAANDGWDENWCECPNCTRLGSDSDELLYFANNVAAEVAKKYPNKKLTLLSYHTTFKPPVSGIKAHPNVEMMFCRETSMTVPLDLGLKIPTGYNPITRVTYTQSWKDNFIDYIKKANLKNIAIWEWHCIAADRAVWAKIPWVQGNVSTRNQKLWKQQGASYIYYDQGPSAAYRETEKSFELRWPLWYVSAKGMWDGSLTGEEILADACNKLFGNAAKEMLAYYKALADSSELCRSSNSIAWVPPNPSEVYTTERIKVIDNAVAAVRNKLNSVTAVEKQRIENQLEYWQNAKPLIFTN